MGRRAAETERLWSRIDPNSAGVGLIKKDKVALLHTVPPRSPQLLQPQRNYSGSLCILQLNHTLAGLYKKKRHADLTSSRSRPRHLPSSWWSLCFSWYESCGIWDCLAACGREEEKGEKKLVMMLKKLGGPSNADATNRDVMMRSETHTHTHTHRHCWDRCCPFCLSLKQNKLTHTHTHKTIYRGVMEQPASKLQKNHLIKLHVLKELTN